MIALSSTVSLLSLYGYVIIFPIAILEGPTIAVISGFLAAQGVFKIIPLFFIFLLGDFAGDVFYYSMGRYGGIPIVKKFEKFLKIKESDIEKMSHHFNKHDIKILLLGKAQPLGSLVLMTAGFIKMNFGRFILINVISSVPKVILFLWIGYYFGSAYAKIDGYLQKIGIIIILVIILAVIIYFLYLKKNKK
jgi:membrane protein DedA with SNARE-associated domain